MYRCVYNQTGFLLHHFAPDIMLVLVYFFCSVADIIRFLIVNTILLPSADARKKPHTVRRVCHVCVCACACVGVGVVVGCACVFVYYHRFQSTAHIFLLHFFFSPLHNDID